MPSHEEHCQDSLRRYGKRFDKLHRWMDEPSTVLGPSHRKYRHDPNKTPQIAKVLFGPLADQACLDHIRLDELERRRKGIPFRGTYRMISPKQKVASFAKSKRVKTIKNHVLFFVLSTPLSFLMLFPITMVT